MSRLQISGAALAVGAVVFPCAAFAAASDDIEPAAPAAPRAALIAPLEYQLEKEIVVRDWVLCVSQAFAETIAKARAASIEQALAAYAALKAAKSCGQFAELRVILKEPPYRSTAGDEAQIFSANVNIAGRWAKAFVVRGGVPVDR